MHHRSFNKQRQTCRECVEDKFAECYLSGMPHIQTIQAVKSVAKTYFCPACLEQSVQHMPASGRLALQLFRSCSTHRHLYQRKLCPCNKPWADCLACMDQGNPRAGGAFCPACRLRYGGGSPSARRCACRRRAATPSPPPALAPGDEFYASDSYLDDLASIIDLD